MARVEKPIMQNQELYKQLYKQFDETEKKWENESFIDAVKRRFKESPAGETLVTGIGLAGGAGLAYSLSTLGSIIIKNKLPNLKTRGIVSAIGGILGAVGLHFALYWMSKNINLTKELQDYKEHLKSKGEY